MQSVLRLLKGTHPEGPFCLSRGNTGGVPPPFPEGGSVRLRAHVHACACVRVTGGLPPRQVRSIAWNPDDSKLVSCGTDGAVYEWSLSSGKRETECVLKSCSYNCVTVSLDAKIIFAVGSDQTLKEIADSSVSPPGPGSRLPPGSANRGSMWAAGGVMGRGLMRAGPLLLGRHPPLLPCGSARSLVLPALPAQRPT